MASISAPFLSVALLIYLLSLIHCDGQNGTTHNDSSTAMPSSTSDDGKGNDGSKSSTLSIWLAILLLFAGIGIIVCVCFLCCRFCCSTGHDEDGNPMFGRHGSSSNSDQHAGVEMHRKKGGGGRILHSHTNSRTQMIQANGDHIRSSEDYNQRPQTVYQKYLQNRKSDNRRLNSMKYQLKITDADGTTKNIETNNNGNTNDNGTLDTNTVSIDKDTAGTAGTGNGHASKANTSGNVGNEPLAKSGDNRSDKSKGKSKHSKSNRSNDDKYASTDSEIAEQYNKLQKSKYQRSKIKSKQRKDRRKQKKSKLRMNSNEKDATNEADHTNNTTNIQSTNVASNNGDMNNGGNNNNGGSNDIGDNGSNENNDSNGKNEMESNPSKQTGSTGNQSKLRQSSKSKSMHMTVETAKVSKKRKESGKSSKKKKSGKTDDNGNESVTDTEALYGDDELSLDMGAIILYGNGNDKAGAAATAGDVAIDMDAIDKVGNAGTNGITLTSLNENENGNGINGHDGTIDS